MLRFLCITFYKYQPVTNTMPGKTPSFAIHLITGLLLLLSSMPATRAAEPPIVAAASDLQFALREIAADFKQQTGHSVRLNFGSSGNFRRQIARGAPFELYMSANEGYVQALQRDGHTLDDGVLYAIGRIAIIAPKDKPALIDESLNELRHQLINNQMGRFAIANPEHAPYGVAAKQLLQAHGLWTDIQSHLIIGENVAQAAQFALSGNTDGGIVAYSLALAPPLQERARYALLPEHYHAPLRQRMVLLRGAGETAKAFYRYLQQTAAREVFNRYGFVLPDEDITEKP